MIIKTLLNLEVDKEGRLYRLSLPIGSSYDEIYNVLLEMRGEILDMSKKAEIKAKEEAEKLSKAEEKIDKEDVKKEAVKKDK